MTETEEAHKSERIEVEGMSCASCAMSIQKRLEGLGLEDVRVDHTSGDVDFINNAGIDEATIEKAVTELGYQVVEQESGETAEKGWSDVEKKFAFSILFSLPLFASMFTPEGSVLSRPLVQLGLALPVYALGFWHFGKSAWNGLRTGVINMDVLIFIGTTAAFGYSLAGTVLYYGTPAVQDYLFFETAAMIISLVLLGNVLETRAVRQTTTAVGQLSELQKTLAKRVVGEGDDERTEAVDAASIRPGDRLLVNSGDKVPVDGEITWGEASVDESMITGESVPVEKQKGDPIVGGTYLQSGSIRVEATKSQKEGVLAGIIEMVRNAQKNKPNIQRLGDKVSSIFVPAVVAIAALTFVISWGVVGISLQAALMNSVAVLVISCPCAMGLATPTAVIAGIGKAAKNGVLIKGGDTLEKMAHLRTVVFDKTGTLTTGDFAIRNIRPLNGYSEKAVGDIIYSLERHSSHPIARSLVEGLEKDADPVVMERVEEKKGEGIEGVDRNADIFLLGKGSDTENGSPGLSYLELSRNGEAVASIELEDRIKAGGQGLMDRLAKKGVRTVLLSGDRAEKCERLGRELGIAEVYSEQKPDQKLALIERLGKEGRVAMVGDGINDAPALKRADVGISLGNATQIAMQSSDLVVLDGDRLDRIGYAYDLSAQTYRTIKQNLFWAFFYNVMAIPLAALGFLNPIIAAGAMAFSDVVVIGNSLRLKMSRSG